MQFVERIKKLDYKCILIIFLCIIFFVGPLFPISYPTDIYSINLLGFKEYAFKWFLPSGRTIGIMFLNIFDSISLGVDSYITIMKIIAIILSIISIYLLYDLIINHSHKQLSKHKYLVLLFSIALLLNHGTYQYFYYPESGIMWLGILLVILALRSLIISDNKFKYLIIWFYIFVAMNCYQAIIYFYLPAVIALTFSKEEPFKNMIQRIVKNFLVVISCLILGYIFVFLARQLFDVISYKSIDLVINIENIKYFFNFLLLNYDYGGIPNIFILLLNLYIMIVSLFETNDKSTKTRLLMAELLIFLGSFLEVYLTVCLTNFYLNDRIQFAYIVSILLNSFLLIVNTNILDRSIAKKIVYCVLTALILFNIGNSHNMTFYYHLSEKNTVEYVNNIKNSIKKYEETSGQKITTIKWCLDSSFTPFDENVRKLTEVSAKRIGEWCTADAIEYYFGNNYKIIQDDDLIESQFDNNNWESFSNDQLKFVTDTLLLCIY